MSDAPKPEVQRLTGRTSDLPPGLYEYAWDDTGDDWSVEDLPAVDAESPVWDLLGPGEEAPK